MRTLVLIAALTFASPAMAAFPEPIAPSRLSELKAMIEAGQAEAALQQLAPLLENETFEADILNLMGFAYRKMGNWADSRIYYTRALSIDPRHKGALEYMGELELQTGNAAAARALLVRLQAACADGCPELDDLLEAFSERGVPVEAQD